MVENVREKIEQALKRKNIVLLGVTDSTVEFYNQYKSRLNIRGCVTHSGELVEAQPMRQCGLEICLFDDYKFEQNDYVVICDYQQYRVFDESLRTNRFVEYEDYTNSKLATCILEEKELMVFMGTCFVGQIMRGLQLQPEIAEKYHCEYYSEDELLQIYKNSMNEYKHLARMSDIYVVSVCDKNMYDAKVVSEGFLRDGHLRITISDYLFDGYYPQIKGDRDCYSGFLYRERERLEIPYGTLANAREDSNLVELVKRNIPVEEIVRKISDPAYYSEEYVNEHFEKALCNIRLSDKKADITIADFIENKCKGKVAYRNLDECNAEVVKYVMKKVAEKISIKIENDDIEKLEEQMEEISGSELPIYPSVLKHLNIEGYADKKYRVVSYYNARYMTFEEYIKYCVEYMYRIKEMNEFLGIEDELKTTVSSM